MPYITKTARTSIDEGGEISTPGELNYKLSMLVDEYISNKPGGLSYTNINEAIGVPSAK